MTKPILPTLLAFVAALHFAPHAQAEMQPEYATSNHLIRPGSEITFLQDVVFANSDRFYEESVKIVGASVKDKNGNSCICLVEKTVEPNRVQRIRSGSTFKVKTVDRYNLTLEQNIRLTCYNQRFALGGPERLNLMMDENGPVLEKSLSVSVKAPSAAPLLEENL